MWGYHDVTDPSDSAMEQPLCWITNAFDRSPAELLWVESANPAGGRSTGRCSASPTATARSSSCRTRRSAARCRAAMCALPIPPFPTGVMRGRFHPGNGQLYACGMFAWAGNQTQPGGFYRVRDTGKPMFLPVGLSARKDGMAITFTDPLDPETAADPSRYAARTWSLKRTVNYGSDHYDEQPAEDHGRDASRPTAGPCCSRSPTSQPTWCMEITYRIKGRGGEPVDGVIHNTIHELARPGSEGRGPVPSARARGAMSDHPPQSLPRVANRTILTPTGGYLASGFTHTINAYQGCAFAGSLCGMFGHGPS